MLPVLIASNSPSAGRTFLAVGLALKLMDMGHSVGFLKPLGNAPVSAGGAFCDADALFAKETLGLPEPPEVIAPVLMTAEHQALLFRDGIKQAQKQVLAALKAFRKRDFVMVCGAGDLLEGSPLGLDPLSLAGAMKAAVLMVEPWRGDLSADALFGAGTLLGERYAGGVFNKVPGGAADHIRDEVRPFLEKKGVPVFGIIPKDQFLESVTVASLKDILNGTVLCCEDRLDEFVENFLIGAMDVDSAFNYFRRTPNKAVITGAHRSDIQLAALETSTKVIILTGGFQTTRDVLDRARARGIPILSVPDDTFTAIDKIELRRGSTSIRQKRKIERAKELIGAGFDMFGFLTKIKKI